jgi:Ca2+-binding EF-hand superfamily protein
MLIDTRGFLQILFSVPLSAVAAEGLKELWQCFDKDGDGAITHGDFATEGELRIWTELRDNFDKDGDGSVSGNECVVCRCLTLISLLFL